MIEARSTLIRDDRGNIRVLRLAADSERCIPLRYTVLPGHAYCHICGCTARFGCIGRCGWANASQTLCTRCADRISQ